MSGFGAIARGLGVTMRNLFKPAQTSQYPEVVREKPERFHGRHILNRYEDGMEKCIGCELCAGVCPARCIYVRGADNPIDDPVSPGERFGYVYDINMLRCIYCALCVEACPTEAITLTNLFEFSFTDRQDAIFDKNDLLVRREDGIPNHRGNPWYDSKSLVQSGGWMRATSPGGAAAFEGVPGWSADRGYGVRPAERGQSSDEFHAEHAARTPTRSPTVAERSVGDEMRSIDPAYED